MSIIVREYDEKDLDMVNKILFKSFNVKKINFNNDLFHEVVSVNNGIVSGYLLLTKVFNPVKDIYYFLVDYVCVSEEYRGTGASDMLINYACSYAKKEGASYLQLTCAPFRVSAHHLYKRCGFEIVDTDLYRKGLI